MSAMRQTTAPTGRKIIVQGKELGGLPQGLTAALGHLYPNRSIPEAAKEGGTGKAHQICGEQLPKLLDELNEVLAA